LALQHLKVLSNRMPDIKIELLKGGGGKESLKTKENIKSGACQVVIGTSAILQTSSVEAFENLGLLVIDEEQRFGVAQKEKLKLVSSGIDILTLSATPIPRTLQMSLQGLKDMSRMSTPPKGRLEVNVTVCNKIDSALIQRAVRAEIARGGQVFLVTPQIQFIPAICKLLGEILPDVKYTIAYGGMKDLEDRFDDFYSERQGSKILIATTVIENGIDMPNVNTIIVLDADCFGMSALYQLRGRVGRSTRQAYAYFMTNKTSLTVDSEERLTNLATFTALGSGYDLSRRDMETRGFGNIFGKDQSGAADVGLDLQSRILNKAVDELKTKL